MQSSFEQLLLDPVVEIENIDALLRQRRRNDRPGERKLLDMRRAAMRQLHDNAVAERELLRRRRSTQ